MKYIIIILLYCVIGCDQNKSSKNTQYQTPRNTVNNRTNQCTEYLNGHRYDVDCPMVYCSGNLYGWVTCHWK